MTQTPERICPECKSTLAASARYCGCGWGKVTRNGARPRPEEAPRVLCATCVRPARHRVRIGAHLWVNVCPEHYPQAALKHLDYVGTARKHPPLPERVKRELRHLDIGQLADKEAA